MKVSQLLSFSSFDPWENLAREELWLDRLDPGASALFLYENRPCVVVGKHQNPLREVRLAEAAVRGLDVVRRATGGGTVWHGPGNLNWGLALPKDRYDRGGVTAAVARALGPLGVDLEATDKGDLFLSGAKVSGSASLVRRDRVLHHGTLLCQADLDQLHGILGPTGQLDEWVGVASRPARVTNLDLTVAEVKAALEELFGHGLGPGDRRDGTEAGAFEGAVARRAAELRAAPWRWDLTPPFTWTGETRLGRARVRVEGGHIVGWESEGDDRSLNLSKMVGKRFFSGEILPYIPTEEGT